MTDNLRDRIAKVLREHHRCEGDDPESIWCSCDVWIQKKTDVDSTESWVSHATDMLIRDAVSPEFLADLVVQAIEEASRSEKNNDEDDYGVLAGLAGWLPGLRWCGRE